MARTALTGIALTALSLTLLCAEAAVGLVLSDAAALGACAGPGPRAADDGPTDLECGTGADARLVAACALGAVLGLGIAIVGAFGSAFGSAFGGDGRRTNAPRGLTSRATGASGGSR